MYPCLANIIVNAIVLLLAIGHQKEAAAGNALYSTVDTSKKKQYVSGKFTIDLDFGQKC